MRSADVTEIEDNDLAQATISILDRIRPYLFTIAAAVAAAFVALAAWTFVSSQKDAEKAQAWDECLSAVSTRDAARLSGVSTRYPGTAAAVWSQILLADNALADGGRIVFTDKAGGRQRLEQAAATYRAVMNARPAEPLAAERATFGLARAHEALGDLVEARRGYEALVKEHPQSPLRSLAEARAAALARPGTATWYDWFAKEDAKPAASDAVPAVSGTTAAPAG
ncbi:MAG: tetratricopeptide repeat protein [Planctomycetaceae bacterium]